MSVYAAGAVGIGSGAFVLWSYYRHWNEIKASASQLTKRQLVVWGISACLAAISFILIAIQWFAKPHYVTGGDDALFLSGLYVFMTGAIAWSWTLDSEVLYAPEAVSLIITAAGCGLMVGGSVKSVMSIPFTSYLLFHHFFVDVVWWSLYARRSPQPTKGMLLASYILGFPALVTSLMLFGTFYSKEARWGCVAVASFDIVIGAVWSGSYKWERFKDNSIIAADVFIIAALVLSAISKEPEYVWPALTLATAGTMLYTIFVPKHVKDSILM